MTPERWAQIEELFHSAAECDPASRASLLDAACVGDPELRREVEALLSCDNVARVSVEAAVHSELDSVGFPLIGETISHYHILEGLGGGGMGLVYRAEDVRLGRQVALKFLPEESARNPASRGRFEREARSASALEHPNICPIYEFAEHGGQPFLAMQLLEGQTLRERISAAEAGKPPFEYTELLDLALQIVDGLDAAHRHGIIHRDIKPANIFVTRQGQAKILDFGLAKLAPVLTAVKNDSARDNRDDRGEDGTPHEVELAGTPDLFLSRTGVAMGTAGYMSPEQARGEKLDARTDLFSFGLVLYEMATGKRAFSGDTGPVLQEAILKQLPAPARKLNPKLPAKLEKIIAKALEKDRQARYQTASEMRTDLGALERPKHAFRWWVAASAGLFLALLATAYFWPRGVPTGPRQIPLEVKYRRITTNPPENRVIGGAISPDRKYLAYSDQNGMHIRQMDTGETRPVPQPAELEGKSTEWEVGPWDAGGTRFLANARPAGSNDAVRLDFSSAWAVAVLGGPPKKLREQAFAFGISPDGSQISFVTKGEHEIWLMGPNGEQAHKFLEAERGHTVCCLNWLRDGQRIFYIDFDAAQDPTMFSRDFNGGPITMIFPPAEMKKLDDFVWLREGRLIYSVPEPGDLYQTCNYWIRRIDWRTGAKLEEPRRLTNWSGFCVASGTVTADEKRLTFLAWASHMTVYAADIEAGGTRLRNSKRFTLDDSENNPMDWTPDSKAIIFFSDRSGRQGIYKQALDSDTPALITSTGDSFNAARVSPDGKWILTNLIPEPKGPSDPIQLARVPISGGSPELIFPLRGVGVISCAKPPSNLCITAERTEDRKQITVSAFDPLKGRGSELLRFDVDPKNDGGWFCDLSADGSRLAVVSDPEEPIRILSLRGQPTLIIPPKEWRNFQHAYWDVDAKGLFLTHGVKGGSELVHLDLQGNARALWKNNGGFPPWGMQSPDGRHLAIQGSIQSGNMWIMENF